MKINFIFDNSIPLKKAIYISYKSLFFI